MKRISEVARELGLPVKTLRTAVRRGRLEAVQLGPSDNSPYRVSDHAVQQWLANHQVRRRV